MSQRDTGYERKERDLYETPAWVTEALLPHLPECRTIWEPAAGSGKMSRVLKGFAGTVISSDIAEGQDFLAADGFDGDAIITNPPYELAPEFIERALSLTASDGLVAMLLRTDFDHAKSRQQADQVVRGQQGAAIVQSRLVRLGLSAHGPTDACLRTLEFWEVCVFPVGAG